MDGTSTTLIVDKTDRPKSYEPRSKIGFAIDMLSKRILFANFKNEMIESVDYDGKNRVNVTRAQSPVSISVDDGTLYWSDSRITVFLQNLCMNQKCTMHTCKLNASHACAADTVELLIEGSRLDFGPHAIKAINPSLQAKVENPCGSNNGGCRQHCLLKSVYDGIGYACACNDGWQLAGDLKDCERKKTNHIYEDALAEHFSKVTSLHQSNNSIFPFPRDLFIRLLYEKPNQTYYKPPFRFIQVNPSGRAIVDREISPKDAESPSYQLDSLLNLLSLGSPLGYSCGSNEPWTLRRYTNRTVVKTLAYDWITNIIYYVVTNGGEEEGELRALKYVRPDRVAHSNKSVETDDVTLIKIEAPTSLILHPYRAYIFAIMKNSSVLRLNSDGSHAFHLPNISEATALLAVDLNDDKLYRLDSRGRVSYSNLDGSDVVQVLDSLNGSVSAFYVHGDWLYARIGEEIRRYHKKSGAKAGSVSVGMSQLYRETVGMKTLIKDAAFDHPCGLDNGNCESFCFVVGDESMKANCACGRDRELLSDGKSCSPPVGPAVEVYDGYDEEY